MSTGGFLAARVASRIGFLVALSLALAGCAVTWLSKYDSRTDAMTTALQKSAALHAEMLATQAAPACFYGQYRDFYAHQHADVGALDLRVRAVPKNGPTVAQVEDLKSGLDSFEAIHKSASDASRCLTPAEMRPAMRGLNGIFGAILKLEIAKQRGEKPE